MKLFFLLIVIAGVYCDSCNMDYIKRGIWISDVIAAENPECRKEHNIDAILTVREDTINVTNSTLLHYAWIFAHDEENQCLMSNFNNSYLTLKQWTDAGLNIIVHCDGGHSRAPTVVIAYLMRHDHWSHSYAEKYVQSKRKNVKPNSGFEKQLKVYDVLNCSDTNTELKLKLEHIIWSDRSYFTYFW